MKLFHTQAWYIALHNTFQFYIHVTFCTWQVWQENNAHFHNAPKFIYVFQSSWLHHSDMGSFLTYYQ